MPSSSDVTQILLDWEGGDADALARLLNVVSDELHRRAGAYLRRERSDHTLQPTALVNEAYLRLVDRNQVRWQSRAHFFAVAATIMRRILVDHSRRRSAVKRGDDVAKVSLDKAAEVGQEIDIDVIALDRALEQLAEFAPRQARIIELRFFGGLAIREVAEVLSISPATVKVDWSMARAWLFSRLGEGAGVWSDEDGR